MGAEPAPGTYSRSQVRRILNIRENRLRSFERNGLYESPDQQYGFSDLVALKVLQRLRQDRVSPQRIKALLSSLTRKLPGVERPLWELKIVPEGRQVAVELPGGRMDALSGQMLLDFEGSPAAQLLSHSAGRSMVSRLREAEHWFRSGLELEEQGADDDAAIEAYRQALALNPEAAGSWVNIGTLRYRRGELEEAERCYREALQSSPSYPLAHFNLGNICEELGRFDEAINHYKLALRLQPTYADAHYNLALVFERRSEAMLAAKHWREYLQLDSSSPWARIARQQLRVLVEVTPGGRHSDNVG
ncbi:MAG: tetratricopeptide repeat protein [Acidobacteria bacterium]|nr:tetratricopeptide repeat protein [Acidobacteriota bacterium]